MIGLGIGAVIALITGKRKKHHKQQPSESNAKAVRQQLQKADEELITVILPTISNDK